MSINTGNATVCFGASQLAVEAEFMGSSVDDPLMYAASIMTDVQETLRGTPSQVDLQHMVQWINKAKYLMFQAPRLHAAKLEKRRKDRELALRSSPISFEDLANPAGLVDRARHAGL